MKVTRRKSTDTTRRWAWTAWCVALGITAVLLTGEQARPHEGHGLGVVGEYDLDAPRTVSDETAAHIGLETGEAERRTVFEVVQFEGLVRPLPDRQEVIGLPAVDARVKKVHVRVGSRVKQGDTVVTVARPGPGSIDLKLQHLKSGVVTQLPVVAGQWTQAGEVLARVADYRVVQIEGQVPESLIPRVRNSESNGVRIRIPSDPSFLARGTVRYVAPELDPVRRTAQVIIDVPNPNGVLRGEMWVNLTVIVQEAKSALVVPRSAVVVHGPMHFVFLHNGDQYQKQDIEPGISDDQFIEVKRGLAPGDLVVMQGAYSLTQLPPATDTDTPPEAGIPPATGI